MNIRDNTYDVFAFLASGETLNITNAITDLSWGDPFAEIAASAQFGVAIDGQGVQLKNKLALCTPVRIVANGKAVFDGIIWEHDYSRKAEATVKIIAYDRLIYAKQSKDNGYWSTGRSTQAIIADICKKWDIPLSYSWKSIKHGKVIYNNRTIADQIIDTLTEAEKQLGKTSNAILESGTLRVAEIGTNKEIYVFKSTEHIMSLSHRRSMDNFITKVIIVSKAEDEERTSIVATVNGKTEYGIIQEIVQLTGTTTMAEAKKEADELLKEQGTPSDIIGLTLPDISTIRKGHKIKVESPDLSGYFIVRGITHSAAARTMEIEIRESMK